MSHPLHEDGPRYVSPESGEPDINHTQSTYCTLECR